MTSKLFDNKLSLTPSYNAISTIDFDLLPDQAFPDLLAVYMKSQFDREADIETLSKDVTQLYIKLKQPISFTDEDEVLSLKNEMLNSRYANCSNDQFRKLIIDSLPYVMKKLAKAIRNNQDAVIADLTEKLTLREEVIAKYRLDDGYASVTGSFLNGLDFHQKLRFRQKLKTVMDIGVHSVAVQIFMNKIDADFDYIVCQAQPKNQASLRKTSEKLIKGNCENPDTWERFFSEKLSKSNVAPLKREIALIWLKYVAKCFEQNQNTDLVKSPALWFQFAGLIALPKSASQSKPEDVVQVKDFYLSGISNGIKGSLFGAMLDALLKSPKDKDIQSVYKTIFNQIYSSMKPIAVVILHAEYITHYALLQDKEHFDQTILPLMKRAAKTRDGLTEALELLTAYIKVDADEKYFQGFYQFIPQLTPEKSHTSAVVEPESQRQETIQSEDTAIHSAAVILGMLKETTHKIPLKVLQTLSLLEEALIVDLNFDLFIKCLSHTMKDKKQSESVRKDKYLTLIDIYMNLSKRTDPARLNGFLTDYLEPFKKDLKYLKIDILPFFKALALDVVRSAKLQVINPYTEVLKLWDELIHDPEASLLIAKAFIPFSLAYYLEKSLSGNEFTSNVLQMVKTIVPPVTIKMEGATPIIAEHPVIKLIFEYIPILMTLNPQKMNVIGSLGLIFLSNPVFKHSIIGQNYLEKYVLAPLLKLNPLVSISDRVDDSHSEANELIDSLLEYMFRSKKFSLIVEHVLAAGEQDKLKLFHYLIRLTRKLSQTIHAALDEVNPDEKSWKKVLKDLLGLNKILISVWIRDDISWEVKSHIWQLFMKAYIKAVESIWRSESIKLRPQLQFGVDSIYSRAKMQLDAYFYRTLLAFCDHPEEVETNNPLLMRIINLVITSCNLMFDSAAKNPDISGAYLEQLLELIPHFLKNSDVSKDIKVKTINQLYDLSAKCIHLFKPDDETTTQLLILSEDSHHTGVNPINRIRLENQNGKLDLIGNIDNTQKLSMLPKMLTKEQMAVLSTSLSYMTDYLINKKDVKSLNLALELVGTFWRTSMLSEECTKMFADCYTQILEASLKLDLKALGETSFYTRMYSPFTFNLKLIVDPMTETSTLQEGDSNRVLIKLTGSVDPKVHSIIRKILSTIAKVSLGHAALQENQSIRKAILINLSLLTTQCETLKLMKEPIMLQVDEESQTNEMKWEESLTKLKEELDIPLLRGSSFDSVLKMLAQK